VILGKFFHVFLVLILLLMESLTEIIPVLVLLGLVLGASIVALLQHICEVFIALFKVGCSAHLMVTKFTFVLINGRGVLYIAPF
jgi:xanthosine utilization system XapX-like protein